MIGFSIFSSTLSTPGSRAIMQTLVHNTYIGEESELPSEITGTIYYVANDGDDSANGTSEATPWETMDKAMGQALSPGDGILFKRGDSWMVDNEPNLKSGTSSGYVVYSAYGSGEPPIFHGGHDKNSTSDWTSVGTNKWETRTLSSAHINSDDRTKLSALILNGEPSPKLVFHNNIGALSSQGEHCHNEGSGDTTVYSVGNPADFYDDIRVSPKTRGLFRIVGRDYWIMDGLQIKWAMHGIVTTSDPSYFKIRKNKVGGIGGALAGDEDRFGNGIEMWGSHNNGEVTLNEIYQCYDAGITSQYDGDTPNQHMLNISVHHNIFRQCAGSYEYFSRSSGGSTTNMKVENNIMFDAGGSWKMQQDGHSDNWGKNVMLWSKRSNSVPHNGFHIRNNIMWRTDGTKEDIHGGWTGSDFNIVNNTYTRASTLFNDASNLIGDPLFVNESTLDLHVQSGSNAIGTGLNLGYTKDYENMKIVYPYNIGVYATPKLA